MKQDHDRAGGSRRTDRHPPQLRSHPARLMLPAMLAIVVMASLYSMRPMQPALPPGPEATADVLTSGLAAEFLINLAATLATTAMAAVIALNWMRRIDRSNRDLARRAALDSLTGLRNRQAFESALTAMLNRANAMPVACFVIDLDSFKPVNDHFGHAAGDGVLREVSRRIQSELRSGAIAGRLGGDEFAVAVPCLKDQDVAIRIAERLTEILSRPYTLSPGEARVGATVGVALQSSEETSAAAMIAQADGAMYDAKSAGGGRFALARDGDDDARERERDALELAIRRGDIRPYYQPQIDLATGRIAGFEALARWLHPQRGTLLPEVFLREVTRHGLQGLFTASIARQVFADVDGWIEAGHHPGRIAINVFNDTLATGQAADELEWLMAQYPAVRDRVTIEITEDVFVARSADRIMENIRQLARNGLQFSLDDFGSGFGSYRHLAGANMGELKIDREFVEIIGDNKGIEPIIEAFLKIAEGLGMTAVAEGIETAEQARFLADRGCPLGQGYLFSPALPASEVPSRLFGVGPAQLPLPDGDAGAGANGTDDKAPPTPPPDFRILYEGTPSEPVPATPPRQSRAQ